MIALLRVGDVFEEDGHEYVITMVNDCRARALPLARRRVELRVAGKDKPIVFSAPERSINISPNSAVKITRRLRKSEVDAIAGKKHTKENKQTEGDQNV